MQKIRIKSAQADICLKCLKKVVYLLVCFFKTFKRKKAIVQKYLGESYLLHPKPTIFMHL